MTRTLRGLLVALVLALVCAPLAVPTPVASADEDPTSPASRFTSCVRGGCKGSVLLLFDTSGSLKETDPEAARVTSAKYLVEQLATLYGELPGADVQIALAGFDHSYRRTLDWTALDTEHLGAINADLDAYATRHDGVETDYWKAVDGARKELAARKKAADGQGCAMTVWFSDGGFAVAKRPDQARVDEWGGRKEYDPDNDLSTQPEANAAVEAGQQDMCRPGGVADQLRSLDIVTMGIGLAVDADEQQFRLMEGFTSATGMPCGDITTPKPGLFTMAKDIDDLIWAFDRSVHGDGDVEENKLCQPGQEPCAEGTRVFVLDGSIGRVQGLAQLPVEGAQVQLQTRDGKLVDLTTDKQSADVPGAKLTWKWLSPQTLTIDLRREGKQEQWVGPWGLVFVAPAKTEELAKSSLRLFGDVQASWLNRDEVQVRTGAKPVELQLGLTDRTGETIDPATLSAESTASVTLTTSDGKSHELATGIPAKDIGKPVKLDPSGLPAGDAELTITLDITTQSWTGGGKTVPGTKLEPISTMLPITVQPPEEFPTIPSKVSFGETESGDPVTVTVPLEGKGCVWLGEKTRFTGYPKGLDAAKLTSTATAQDSCTKSGLELTLDPGGVGNGALVGTAEVWLISPSATKGTPVQLQFDLQMSRPASQPVLWGTLVGVTLLGIAIPVGILYLTKYLTAKIPGDAVLAQQVRGRVDDTGAFTDGGLPVDVSRMSIAHLANNRRRVEVAGVTLRARMGAAPTEPGYVVVEQPGSAVGGRTTMAAKGDRAKLPLAVQGNWTVALDPDRPHSGDVVVTVFTGPGAPGLDELLDAVRSNIRDAVAGLRSGLPPEPQGPVNDPWGGGPSGGPGQPDPWSNPGQPQRWSPQGGPAQGGPAPSGPAQGGPPSQGPRPSSPPPGGPGSWQTPPGGGWNAPPPSGGAGW